MSPEGPISEEAWRGAAAGRMTLVHLVSGYASTWLVVACARFGIADLLSRGPLDAKAIALAIDGDVSSVMRFMETLVVLGVVDHDNLVAHTTRYRANDVSHWLRSDVPGNHRELALLSGEASIQAAWAAIDVAVRRGQSGFEAAHGVAFFDHLDRHPSLLATFQRAGGGDPDWNLSIATACDLSTAHSIVDIGGGDGEFLSAVLTMHPHLEGVLFERARVIELGAERTATAWEAVAGDFLDPLPARVAASDRLVLRRILHDWDDDRATRILSHCRGVMNDASRLLVIEYVVSPERRGMTALLDFTMLVLNGGRERTLAEFEALLARADLELEEVIATPVAISILVVRTATKSPK